MPTTSFFASGALKKGGGVFNCLSVAKKNTKFDPCDQEPVRTFRKGPPPEKAKLRRCWTYLSQLRLTVHHIQGVRNECADYISRNNFDALIGARSEALAKEAFSRMDVHLDLNMTMIRPLDGLQQAEYLKEFGDIYKRLENHLEPLLVNQEQ